MTLFTQPDDPARPASGGPYQRVPPVLAALAGQFAGLRVEKMLPHDGKSLLAAGHAGDQPVMIKVLPEGDLSARPRPSPLGNTVKPILCPGTAPGKDRHSFADNRSGPLYRPFGLVNHHG